MYKGRLFTFGCSFTKYKWPTWADLLGQEFESYYNFGKSGGGNLFISCSLAEANARYKFTPDDTVMVMWTNVTREDRYISDWVTPGNIYSQGTYSEEFVKKYITIRGCYVRDIAQMHLTKSLLENTGCTFHIMNMVDITTFSQFYKQQADGIEDILMLYDSTLSECLPSVNKVLFNYDWDSIPINDGDKRRHDAHPLPLEHIEYINTVLPMYKFSDSTLQFASEVDYEIREAFRVHNKHTSYDDKADSWITKLQKSNRAVRF